MFYFIFKKKKKEKKKSSRVSKIFSFLSFFFFALGLCLFAVCVFLEREDIVLLLNLDVKLPDFNWREADYSAQEEFYFCLKSNWWGGKILNIRYHKKYQKSLFTVLFKKMYMSPSSWK